VICKYRDLDAAVLLSLSANRRRLYHNGELVEDEFATILGTPGAATCMSAWTVLRPATRPRQKSGGPGPVPGVVINCQGYRCHMGEANRAVKELLDFGASSAWKMSIMAQFQDFAKRAKIPWSGKRGQWRRSEKIVCWMS